MNDILSNQPLINAKTEMKFLAFIDLLGFGKKVENEFENVVEFYEHIINAVDLTKDIFSDLSIKLYSDSILITSDSLSKLVNGTQIIITQCLFFESLVRGGIGYGKHIEVANTSNLFVISQALVQAVEIEKSIQNPCIALHPSLNVPSQLWDNNLKNIQRSLLFYKDNFIVNPFNIAWGQSAKMRIIGMQEQFPNQSAKYKFLLDVFNAVFSEELLIPKNKKP